MNWARSKVFARPVAYALMVSVSAVSLGACAGAGQPFSASLRTDATDSCAAYVQQLNSVQEYFEQSIIQGAAVGALGGAAAGALIGGDWQSALIGGALGAAAGAATGYYSARAEASGGNQTELVRNIYGDVIRENQQLDRTSGYFVQVRDCRFNQARDIKRQFAAGQITREVATQQLNTIQGRFQQEIAFAEGLGSKISGRSTEFANASTQLQQSDPQAVQVYQQRKATSVQTPPPSPYGGSNAQNLNANSLEANAAAEYFTADANANVRSGPSASSTQVGRLAKGERVVGVIEGSWVKIELANGTQGYVARSLVLAAGEKPRPRPPAQRPAQQQAAAVPSDANVPQDTAGVLQLTESNQLRRQAFSDSVNQAKVASQTEFQLDAPLASLGFNAA
ncbi:SH3 domain-containing protein [Zavarzinia sp. CC-PAN008]|uniref:SH3 domain-containing protein n=1 Tax=Zavarzinia sp. CC-PAN008 TaxID=3243332 RepID=UPI003F743C90